MRRLFARSVERILSIPLGALSRRDGRLFLDVEGRQTASVLRWRRPQLRPTLGGAAWQLLQPLGSHLGLQVMTTTGDADKKAGLNV